MSKASSPRRLFCLAARSAGRSTAPIADWRPSPAPPDSRNLRHQDEPPLPVQTTSRVSSAGLPPPPPDPLGWCRGARGRRRQAGARPRAAGRRRAERPPGNWLESRCAAGQRPAAAAAAAAAAARGHSRSRGAPRCAPPTRRPRRRAELTAPRRRPR